METSNQNAYLQSIVLSFNSSMIWIHNIESF